MITLAAATAWIERSVERLATEPVPLASSVGRVLPLSRPALAPGPPRAWLDGIAVAASATEGASDYAPIPIRGMPVLTGASLPPGTDAVLPIHLFENGCALLQIASGSGVAPAENLAVDAGLVRPAHLAVLAQRGETELDLVRRPRVRLAVAGADLAAMLQAMIASQGGIVDAAMPDLVILAGCDPLESVFADAIAMQPGERTMLGTVGGVPALALPNDAMSCAAAFDLLAAPALRRLGGYPEPEPLTATLTRKITSGLGMAELVRVQIRSGVATPLGPTLSAGAAADGFVLVPEGSEGYPAGAAIAIYPLP